ncbi:MAG: hypothetical protein ABIJ50_10170 [Pseudomonadota bacterium]
MRKSFGNGPSAGSENRDLSSATRVAEDKCLSEKRRPDRGDQGFGFLQGAQRVFAVCKFINLGFTAPEFIDNLAIFEDDQGVTSPAFWWTCSFKFNKSTKPVKKKSVPCG